MELWNFATCGSKLPQYKAQADLPLIPEDRVKDFPKPYVATGHQTRRK
jgi:hypothetical protein